MKRQREQEAEEKDQEIKAAFIQARRSMHLHCVFHFALLSMSGGFRERSFLQDFRTGRGFAGGHQVGGRPHTSRGTRREHM